ncbi:MAG: 30S ribosomal protein S15 [Candidatus Micrarchaeaceae archaeon]
MARMHTRKHGKSKSRKPVVEIGSVPEGLTLSKEEVKKIILDYAKQNMPEQLIGQKLKDEHKVPYVKQLFGKKLTEVLAEEGASRELPQDLLYLMKKAVVIRNHLASNHKDTYNRIRLGRIESKIWRLVKYYKRTGVLPESWKYDHEKAALLVKGI